MSKFRLAEQTGMSASGPLVLGKRAPKFGFTYEGKFRKIYPSMTSTGTSHEENAMTTKIRYFFLFSAIALTSNERIVGQTLTACLQLPSTEVRKSNHGCEDWKRLTFRDVSICVPKDFAVENAPSVEGGRFQYLADGLRFSVNYNIDAWQPVIESRLSSFQEQVLEKGKTQYWIWNFKDRDGWKFTEGMNVWDGLRLNYVAGVYLFTNSVNYQSLAKRIFSSACYEPRAKK